MSVFPPITATFDENDRVIKVDTFEAKSVSRFGTSLLYRWGDYNFHPRAIEILSKIQNLIFKEDDVVLCMFPKSGSTWLSECIYLIVNQYKYELASEESIEFRFPQIDSPSHDVFNLILKQYNDLNQRRLIKSSVPPNLLIERADLDVTKPKVISIFRNPRDVLVSFYHHCKTVKHYDIGFSFEDFFETFLRGQVPCGPIWKMYNDMFKYHQANPESTMVVFYEDMKQDLRAQVGKVCAFLNCLEPNDERGWAQLLDHLSVDRMRQNKTINRHDWDKLGLRNSNGFEFVRKGQVNDWKNFFNDEQSIRFDREIIDKLLPELKARYGQQRS